MKKLQTVIDYELLHYEELPEDIARLVDQAKEATYSSYAPYSNFHVGAAVLLQNGVVVRGCNQENDAFPSGLCAERTALFAAGVDYPVEPIIAIAVAASSKGFFLEQPITPCGACAQVLLQSEIRTKSPLHIYLYGTKGILHLRGVKCVLPFAFSL